MTADHETRGTGLVLVGYRGSGKSSVGRTVAARLGRPFADLDREIEASEGRTVRAVFAEGGEAAFRAIEAQVLGRVVIDPSLAGGVISTGGGAVLAEANRRALRRFGMVAWLSTDPGVLAGRLARSSQALIDRPSLTGLGTLDEIAGVLAARTPVYREVADLVIATDDRSVDQVAGLVIDAWLGVGSEGRRGSAG